LTEGLGLSTQERERIRSGNAIELLKLEVPVAV
jgi:aminocarboxymuconate-semialdehyde decarboxylase